MESKDRHENKAQTAPSTKDDPIREGVSLGDEAAGEDELVNDDDGGES
jgi:hypothetical protein